MSEDEFRKILEKLEESDMDSHDFRIAVDIMREHVETNTVD